MTRLLNLNADLGESFGAWQMGNDAELLGNLDSASIACGFHAGDPDVMARTMALAVDRGVAIGAHPGFPDLQGFGRRRMELPLDSVKNLVRYQVAAAAGMARAAGGALAHVKLHGALANLAVADSDVAAASVRAIKGVDASLACLAIAHGKQERCARDAGLRTYSEVYADRGYQDDGSLMPRNRPGAFVHDPAEAVERACRMVTSGEIVSVKGKALPTAVDSICVHGDSPTALATARLLAERLAAEGIALAPFTGRP